MTSVRDTTRVGDGLCRLGKLQTCSVNQTDVICYR